MNTGAVANCRAFLTALDTATAGTAAAVPIPDVNFWTNLYIAQNPPGCGGLGWYNTPGALTNTSFSTAAHEVSHNIGINHASNQHGESAAGTDWEPWPYTHGSIGAVDETQNFDDGVFGAVMYPNAASLGLDMINNWGVWWFGPVSPCISATDSTLFPTCTAVVSSFAHDSMSYGPTTPVLIWGQQNWISDLNYYRLLRWFEDCRQLDPPNRFMSGGTIDIRDTSGECNGRGSPAAGATPAQAGAAPQEALIFSGVIGDSAVIRNFRAVRKLATPGSFANASGTYLLTMHAADGSVIRSIPFAERIAPGEAEDGRSFAVVAPYDARLAKVEIKFNQQTVFSQDASRPTPVLSLISPQGGEIWRTGEGRIEWRLDNPSTDTEVYIQYSPDKGESWFPLGLVGGGQNYRDVNVEELLPSNNALVYVSAANGLNTAAAITEKMFAVGQQ